MAPYCKAPDDPFAYEPSNGRKETPPPDPEIVDDRFAVPDACVGEEISILQPIMHSSSVLTPISRYYLILSMRLTLRTKTRSPARERKQQIDFPNEPTRVGKARPRSVTFLVHFSPLSPYFFPRFCTYYVSHIHSIFLLSVLSTSSTPLRLKFTAETFVRLCRPLRKACHSKAEEKRRAPPSRRIAPG